MREIKFRVWDKENEYMINSKQGVYTALRNVMNITRQDDEYYNNGDLLKPNKEKYILMQYTGLKDKNGTEIYEGDIVKIHKHSYDFGFKQEEIGQIKFIDGAFGFYKEKSKNEYYFNTLADEIAYHEIEEYEVIGNIYDNPELLEAGD